MALRGIGEDGDKRDTGDTPPEVTIIEELRDSYRKHGPIRSVIETPYGVAAGNTRLKAVPEWPRKKLDKEKVPDYYTHLKIMAADNIAESKTPEWWTRILSEAAKELEKQGIPRGEITARLDKDFPAGKWRIYAYLPKEFKAETRPIGSTKTSSTNADFGDQNLLSMSRKSVVKSTTEIPPPVVNKPGSQLREVKYRQGPSASDYQQSSYTKQHLDFGAELNKRGLHPDYEYKVLRFGEYHCPKGHVTRTPTEDVTVTCERCRLPAPVKTYRVDLYFPDEKVAVEVEGEGSSSKDNEERDRYLESKGVSILHISNEEVKKNLNSATDKVVKLVSEKRAAHLTPEPPKQTLVDQLHQAISEGTLTPTDFWRTLDVRDIRALDAGRRKMLIGGSMCPVCGHEIADTGSPEHDAMKRLMRE